MERRPAGFTKRRLGWLAAALVVLLVAGMATNRLMSRPRTFADPPDSEIDLTRDHEGTIYKLCRGNVYTVGPEPGRLTLPEEPAR